MFHGGGPSNTPCPRYALSQSITSFGMHSNVLCAAGAAVWSRSCFAFEGSTNCRRPVKAPASRSTKPAKVGIQGAEQLLDRLRQRLRDREVRGAACRRTRRRRRPAAAGRISELTGG